MKVVNPSDRYLLGFVLTDHFLLRQWERRISDQDLKPILRELNHRSVSDGMVLVPIDTKDRFYNTLFIKIKRRLLVTCFISTIAEYMGRNLYEHYVLCDQKLRMSHLMVKKVRKAFGGYGYSGNLDPNVGPAKTQNPYLVQSGSWGKPWHVPPSPGKK